jgi:hypothetical protein
MNNTTKLGCLIVFLAAGGFYYLWSVLLYIGIPLAVIVGFVAWRAFKHYEFDETDGGADARLYAGAAGGVALILGLLSIGGNVFSDHGPFGKPTAAQIVAEPAEMVDGDTSSDDQLSRRLKERLVPAMEACDPYASPAHVNEHGMDAYYMCLENNGISKSDLEEAKRLTLP